jgi:hypothetical protein
MQYRSFYTNLNVKHFEWIERNASRIRIYFLYSNSRLKTRLHVHSHYHYPYRYRYVLEFLVNIALLLKLNIFLLPWSRRRFFLHYYGDQAFNMHKIEVACWTEASWSR